MNNKENIKIKYGCIIFITFIIMVYGYLIITEITTNNINNNKIKELEKQNYCYQVLYNEDIIGNNCDEYFKNDSWYKEYKQAEK